MIPSAFRARLVALAALSLTLVGLVGCNSDNGGETAALPPSDGSPPPAPPKDAIGPNGKPTRSSAAYDSARGGKAP